MNLTVATVIFAATVASLIAMPAPQRQSAPVMLVKADRLAARPAESSCSQQNWPHFDASCLRYTDDKQAVREIRAVGDQG